jgi:hypothetical protein
MGGTAELTVASMIREVIDTCIMGLRTARILLR